jgi:hypothetical protein
MPKGLSIHIGLNGVNPEEYDGWLGILNSAEKDAIAMCVLALSEGFHNPVLLLTHHATSKALFQALSHAAHKLDAGDILLLTYSGHGVQQPNRVCDEADGLDEAWALYDREVLDDELFVEWSKFRPGVRILVVSDSCRSGTILKNLAAAGADEVGGVKEVPQAVQTAYYASHKAMFEDIERRLDAEDPVTVTATVALIPACRDNQDSHDGRDSNVNSVFTKALLDVWGNGGFNGDYCSFCQAIASVTTPIKQTPIIATTGMRSRKFLRERPFTI